MGKGSGRRPKQISADEEARRWELTFGNKSTMSTNGNKQDEQLKGSDNPVIIVPNEEG